MRRIATVVFYCLGTGALAWTVAYIGFLDVLSLALCVLTAGVLLLIAYRLGRKGKS